MPRTEEDNQRIREEQHAKILEAALGVFARRGMDATIAEVAAAADISYGLVYRYFASKEALLVELVEKVLSDSLMTLEQALEMPGTPGERLHSLLNQVLNGVREHPEFILLVQQMLGEEAERNHLHELAQEQSRRYRAVLKRLIVEGQTTGEIANDNPDQLVAAVTACIAGLSQAATWQEPEHFQKTFPDVAIILRMFIPQ